MSAEVQQKPGLMEQVGVAVNTKNLTVDPDHTRAADKIMALGMAASAVARARNPYPNRNVIEARLAPLLWSVRAGDQRGYDLRLSNLFASWLFVAGKLPSERPDQVERGQAFAERVIHELLNDKCAACRGCGRQEQIAGKWMPPRGGVRNAQLKTCMGCGGSGRRKGNKHARAHCLDLRMEGYLSAGWELRFERAFRWLDIIARRLNKPLQSKLKGSSIRAN